MDCHSTLYTHSASDTDLGLALGGRLKLVRAGVQYATAPGAPTSEEAIISLPSTAKAMACLRRAPDVALGLLDEFGLPIGPSVTDMDVCPSDSSRFVVACTSGQVLHRSRAGEELFPSSFSRDVDVRDGQTHAVSPMQSQPRHLSHPL